MYLLARFLLIVFSILVTAALVPGIVIEGLSTALFVALVLGLLNITVRPILFVLTLPITVLTLGLFAFILNASLLYLVAYFVEGFSIENFFSAFIGAILISLVNWIGSKFIRTQSGV